MRLLENLCKIEATVSKEDLMKFYGAKFEDLLDTLEQIEVFV
jgi:hypothetical protein